MISWRNTVSLVDDSVGGAVTSVEFGPSRRLRQKQQHDSKGDTATDRGIPVLEATDARGGERGIPVNGFRSSRERALVAVHWDATFCDRIPPFHD